MKYIEEIFDNIELEKFQRDGDCIYDSIRSFLLAATPEECVRQKTIVYLQQQLGIPVNRIFVEESMAHTKKGARGRADIVVYRDDECTDVLMIIECKAPYINVLGDEVFKQASGYREILNAEYIMLVNGVEAVVYIYNDGEYFEVKDIPSFEEFMNYAKTLDIYEEGLDVHLKIKYETWKDDGWVSGYNKPIVNWKQTLKNTMPYLRSNNKNIFNVPKINRPKSTYNE